MSYILLLKILLIPVLTSVSIIVGLFYKGIDRILIAKMQKRVGPPLLQPFFDVEKLMVKENIIPQDSLKWLFNLMPVIALSASILILLYLPLAGMEPILAGQGDLILIVYLFIFPGLALVLGGFSANSPYAGIGAQREMVNILSYEFPLAVTVISVAWLQSRFGMINPFSLTVISNNPVWGLVGPMGLIGLFLLFLILLVVMTGELSRVPFDVAKAESEIAGGSMVEYSGRNLALFYLANAVKTIAFASLIVVLFLPWNLPNLWNLPFFAGLTLNILFFLIKLFIVIFLSSTLVKVITSRLRINQIVSTYWLYATLISFIGLLLIWIDVML